MKIIINVSAIFKGGAEQVANSFINECRKFPDHEYHIFLRKNIMEYLDIENFPDNFFFYKIDQRPGSGLFTFIKTMRYFDSLEKNIKPDVVISTGGHGYWRPKVPLVVGFNIPHYIYPESPYFDKISAKGRLRWAFKKKVHMWFYGRADAIVVQTDDVNSRLKALLPGIEIQTVSNTVNGSFLEPEACPKKLPQKPHGEVRLLTVSSYYPHKNLDVIKETLDELFERGVSNIKFVLTLPDDKFNEFREYRFKDHIINVGPVTIAECPSLYQECDAMFLPTLLECFSASYAEAMATRRPILTSDLGFAHTVCKDAALYFDPVNGKDIADKIERFTADKELQQRLQERGAELIDSIITPEERAEKYLSICEGLIKG